jgi:hypothetical protein
LFHPLTLLHYLRDADRLASWPSTSFQNSAAALPSLVRRCGPLAVQEVLRILFGPGLGP